VTDSLDLFGRQRRGQIFRVNDNIVVAERVIFGESIFHQQTLAIQKRGVKTELFKMSCEERKGSEGEKNPSPTSQPSRDMVYFLSRPSSSR
jgi:hypothetical protein